MTKKLLHVGCGSDRKQQTIPVFFDDDWEEIRYDIDLGAQPDILGDLLDMSDVPDSSIDAIYSSHNIEHLYEFQVVTALKEMCRVLKNDGFLVVGCPDLISVCKFIVEHGLSANAYKSPAGPISPHDMLYGYGADIEKGKVYMAHKSGFDVSKLHDCFAKSGFFDFVSFTVPSTFAIWSAARKSQGELTIKDFAAHVFKGVPGFPG